MFKFILLNLFHQVTWEPFYETPGGLSDFQQDLQGQYSNPLDDSTSTDKHNASAFGYINLGKLPFILL